MARPMPVLPLVASITVWPGFSSPDLSAASMTPSARRSFTDPSGLNASIFTKRSMPGGARRLILTTGIAGASVSIPNLDRLTSLGEGQRTYTSSGRVMLGRWVMTPVALIGADGAQLETEPMPVLAVMKVACLEHARDCEPSDEPR